MTEISRQEYNQAALFHYHHNREQIHNYNLRQIRKRKLLDCNIITKWYLIIYLSRTFVYS